MDRTHERKEGELRKENILQTLAARRESYVVAGRRALVESLLAFGLATADDVRRSVTLPAGVDARCFGSVPGPLARAGIIRRAGFVPSDRRERHASYIAVWELADEPAALAWLAVHPGHDGASTAGNPASKAIPSNDTSPALAMPGLF